VIGDATLDVVIGLREPMRPGGDVPASITVMRGGQGANVAVRLARRGLAVRLVCALGEDDAGALVRRGLEREGVDIDAVGVDATTSVVAVLVPAGGARTMLSDRAPLDGELAAALEQSTAQWVVVSGYAVLDLEAVALPRLPAAARRVVLGCDVPDPEVERWTAAVGALRPEMTILNAAEARAAAGVAGGRRDELAGHVAKRLGGIAIVTDADGAAASDGQSTVESRARPPADAVDTTGAGDALAASVIVALAAAAWPPSSDRLREAIEAGVDAARETVAVRGAQAPTASESRRR
jgi:ribokinase